MTEALEIAPSPLRGSRVTLEVTSAPRTQRPSLWKGSHAKCSAWGGMDHRVGGGDPPTTSKPSALPWTPAAPTCREQGSGTVASASLLGLSHGAWSRCRPQPCHPLCKNPKSPPCSQPPRSGNPARTQSSRAWWRRILAFRTHCTGHPHPPSSQPELLTFPQGHPAPVIVSAGRLGPCPRKDAAVTLQAVDRRTVTPVTLGLAHESQASTSLLSPVVRNFPSAAGVAPESGLCHRD